MTTSLLKARMSVPPKVARQRAGTSLAPGDVTLVRGLCPLYVSEGSAVNHTPGLPGCVHGSQQIAAVPIHAGVADHREDVPKPLAVRVELDVVADRARGV